MDYTSLTNQIKAYAYRTDAAFIAAIPNFIEQAMSRIYSEVKAGGFQQIVESDLAVNIPFIIKPLLFKSPVSLQITIPADRRPDNKPFITYLEQKSYEYCTTYWPDPTATGIPVFYSTDLPVPQISDSPSYIYLAPTPYFTYDYTLTYLSFPPLFNAQNSRNYLTDKYPDLLLNACMVEVVTYLRFDERIPVFEAKYKACKDAANSDTRGRYVDRTEKRDKT